MKQKSQSVSKRSPKTIGGLSDVRVAETCRKIDDAFVQLLFVRPYKSLRVSEITKKAGVGRVTFYAHYKSKDELLKSQMNRIIVPLFRAVPEAKSLIDGHGFFAHVRQAPQLFRNIMSGGEGSGGRVVRAALEERLDVLMRGNATIGAPVPTSLVKRFVVSTLLTIVVHGLQPSVMESGDEMQWQFEKLVGAGLSEQTAR